MATKAGALTMQRSSRGPLQAGVADALRRRHALAD
jgi:hypothetical protein